ncbi:MAG: ABC transporter permease [Clostridiales Family XIII bacterium]|jgi:putative ABC transport system permease protein|nr:ABC transporter permease [Clostridiales Family XIII bacterium]
MSFNLAIRNVKKSYRDYAIYFLTITFGVCIFYVFNSIESQQSMMALSENEAIALKQLNRIMGGVSVFISVIFGFLILYANRFLLKRRKKELGIYMTLGMERRDISKILTMETILVGILSLFTGLILGILLSQGLAVVTAKLFMAKLTTFSFIFSFSALMKATIYFGIAFGLVTVFNACTIGRHKLIDLIYAEHKNEKFKSPHLVLSVCLFILSVACLVIAYWMILKYGFSRSDRFWISISLGCVGTFLFFFSLSGFFLKLISQSKRIYLKNLNMFVLRQINSKINTTYVSLTLVCLMLFVTICAFSSGIGTANAITQELDDKLPYDASYSIEIRDQKSSEHTQDFDIHLIAGFEEQGVNFERFAKQYVEVKYYDPKVTFHLMYEGEDFDYMPWAIRLSDYNALMDMQGKPALTLDDDEVIINSNLAVIEEMEESLKSEIAHHSEILINDRTYQTDLQSLQQNQLRMTGFSLITLIVPDTAIDGMLITSNDLNINYIAETELYEEIAMAAFINADFTKVIEDTGEDGFSISYETKIKAFEGSRISSALVAYLSIYIGIVFLIIAAAVLAITQLSEASDNAHRYGLLRKIGTDQKMIHKALFTQIFVYFGVPLFLAIVHSVIGIFVANDLVKELGRLDMGKDSIITAVIIFVVYGSYFIATYLGSKNIVNRKMI